MTRELNVLISMHPVNFACDIQPSSGFLPVSIDQLKILM